MKVGDRVEVSSEDCEVFIRGKIGTIVGISDGPCVEFDEHDHLLHGGSGLGKKGHCWFVREEDLTFLESYPVTTTGYCEGWVWVWVVIPSPEEEKGIRMHFNLADGGSATVFKGPDGTLWVPISRKELAL